MNQTIADAIRKEGVTEDGIKRIQQALWDAELCIQWDRNRWEANMRRRAEEARAAEAEAAKALCVPYTGKITQCMASVTRPGSWHSGRCLAKPKFARRDYNDNVIVVCGTHARKAQWSMYVATGRRGEPVAVVESEYQPPKGK